MQGFSGSHNKYITALSPATSYVAAGSTGPSNFGGYEWGTLIVSLGSPPNAAGGGLVVNVQRSATSDGTFANFGASMALAAGSRQTGVRSFAIDSSAIWHKVSYDQNNGANWNGAILVALARPRVAPVPTQDTHTTVFSDVVGG